MKITATRNESSRMEGATVSTHEGFLSSDEYGRLLSELSMISAARLRPNVNEEDLWFGSLSPRT